jgi:hypothetical protein
MLLYPKLKTILGLLFYIDTFKDLGGQGQNIPE